MLATRAQNSNFVGTTPRLHCEANHSCTRGKETEVYSKVDSVFVISRGQPPRFVQQPQTWNLIGRHGLPSLAWTYLKVGPLKTESRYRKSERDAGEHATRGPLCSREFAYSSSSAHQMVFYTRTNVLFNCIRWYNRQIPFLYLCRAFLSISTNFSKTINLSLFTNNAAWHKNGSNQSEVIEITFHYFFYSKISFLANVNILLQLETFQHSVDMYRDVKWVEEVVNYQLSCVLHIHFDL